MSLIFLLFLLIFCYCNCLPSTLALIQPMPWYDKIAALTLKVWLCYEYDYASHRLYGLYDYHMPVIYYNTVTM